MGSLKGTRISLRGPEPDDLDSLYLWENDASLWPYGATRAPLSRHQIWQYIDSYDGDVFSQRQLRMMIVDNLTGRAAGSVDLYDFDARDGRVCVGIFTAPEFRRQGFAREAMMLSGEYCRDTLGLHQMAAWVTVENKTSIPLFKSAGFKTRACLKSWIRLGRRYVDVLVFQKFFV